MPCQHRERDAGRLIDLVFAIGLRLNASLAIAPVEAIEARDHEERQPGLVLGGRVDDMAAFGAVGLSNTAEVR